MCLYKNQSLCFRLKMRIDIWEQAALIFPLCCWRILPFHTPVHLPVRLPILKENITLTFRILDTGLQFGEVMHSAKKEIPIQNSHDDPISHMPWNFKISHRIGPGTIYCPNSLMIQISAWNSVMWSAMEQTAIKNHHAWSILACWNVSWSGIL